MKQFWPISMDWRDERIDTANDVVYWKALSFILTLWRWGRSDLHCQLSCLPVNKNDAASLKQFWPISMDWRDGRFDISNDVAFWNALSLNCTLWSWGRPIFQFSIFFPNHSIQMTAPYWNKNSQIQWTEWLWGSTFQMIQY